MSPLVQPALAMVGLTFVVWCYMYFKRLRFIRVHSIDPQSVATRALGAKSLAEVAAPSDNLMNLFEMPVLFYFLIALLMLTNQASEGFVTAAWVYVALRVVHSFIHCTYNRVLQRFLVYAASSLLLWGMWAAFVLKVLS
ncbi:MAG TPA: MAPEG family protein [Steroidobacteraceae bacterium]|jgi:hypothetical protein|nr:MAPEG family protein [Steroidobacteraceae bacterium]